MNHAEIPIREDSRSLEEQITAAIISHDFVTITDILDQGLFSVTRSVNGGTMLTVAISEYVNGPLSYDSNSARFLKALLDRGSDVNLVLPGDLQTPIIYAIEMFQRDSICSHRASLMMILYFLLDAGADVQAVNSVF
jgi:hypothetical protein